MNKLFNKNMCYHGIVVFRLILLVALFFFANAQVMAEEKSLPDTLAGDQANYDLILQQQRIDSQQILSNLQAESDKILADFKAGKITFEESNKLIFDAQKRANAKTLESQQKVYKAINAKTLESRQKAYKVIIE